MSMGNILYIDDRGYQYRKRSFVCFIPGEDRRNDKAKASDEVGVITSDSAELLALNLEQMSANPEEEEADSARSKKAEPSMMHDGSVQEPSNGNEGTYACVCSVS